MELASVTVLDLIKEIIGIINKVKSIYKKFESEFEKLVATLTRLEPRIKKVGDFYPTMKYQSGGTDDLMAQRQTEMNDLKKTLEECKELVDKCPELSYWKFSTVNDYANKLEDYNKKIEDFIRNTMIPDIWEKTMVGTNYSYGSAVPQPEFTVGWEEPVWELKRKLVEENISVVGICGLGGCGKTTLVTKLCEQLKDNFGKIIYLPISETPEWKEMFGRLWTDLVHSKAPNFVDEKDAHSYLMSLKPHDGTILVVLDDIWKQSDLENFLINKPGFHTVFTSRTEFTIRCYEPAQCSIHKVPKLSMENAKTLFLKYACPGYGEQNLDDENKESMEMIVRRCDRHPLALRVLGSSLEGKRRWRETGLFEGGKILKNEEDEEQQIFTCLEASLTSLNEKYRERFRDLCLFPHNKRIRASAVLDMWVQVHSLGESSARDILQELSKRNLIDLFERTGNEKVGALKEGSTEDKRIRQIHGQDESFNDLFVTQHDLLSELAYHSSSSTYPKRLIIDELELPRLGQQKDIISEAQFVSIRGMKHSDQPDLVFPRTEVLILNFSSNAYCLPPFLKNMENLKVLIIENQGSYAAKITGFPLKGSLKNLRRVRLEKISLPTGFIFKEPFPELEKLAMVLCEFNQEENWTHFKAETIFPELRELEIDYCNGLERFPSGFFERAKLQKLSITNCHDLIELPSEIGRLKQLEVLRLKACTELEFLPESLSGLGKLRFLDISDCFHLSTLPESMSDLCGLRRIDMRGCSSKLPVSVRNMVELRTVICNEDTAKSWEDIKIFLTKLELDVRKDTVHLGFLY